MTGKSQPAACDATFGQWAADGQLTNRKSGTAPSSPPKARNYALANSLVKTLPTLGAQGRLMIDVAQKPDMLSDPSRFLPANEAMSDAVGLGLRRLARQGPGQGHGPARRLCQQHALLRDEKVSIAREIGLTLARRYDPRALDVMTKYDPELRDNTVSEWRLRLLLRLARWEDAYQLTRKLPQDLGHHQPLALLGRRAAWSWPSRRTRSHWCCTKTSRRNVISMVSSPPIAPKRRTS